MDFVKFVAVNNVSTCRQGFTLKQKILLLEKQILSFKS